MVCVCYFPFFTTLLVQALVTEVLGILPLRNVLLWARLLQVGETLRSSADRAGEGPARLVAMQLGAPAPHAGLPAPASPRLCLQGGPVSSMC